jgi:hypothetical protein
VQLQQAKRFVQEWIKFLLQVVVKARWMLLLPRLKDIDHYQPPAKAPSSLGARTAGYSGKVGKKGFDRLYLAVPARANHGAEVWIYTVQD